MARMAPRDLTCDYANVQTVTSILGEVIRSPQSAGGQPPLDRAEAMSSLRLQATTRRRLSAALILHAARAKAPTRR